MSTIGAKEAIELFSLEKADVYELFARAGKVRQSQFGQEIALCGIINAKSGRCPEDCAFCSQSSHYETDAPSYELLDDADIFERAKAVKAMGARAFSIVNSGRRLKEGEEARRIYRLIERIRGELDLECCASLGRVDAAILKNLKAAGLTRYHHNLETARSFFPKIVSTYPYDESIETIKRAFDAGLEVCAAGVFGLGESRAARVELAETLRDLGVKSVPINFLNPRAGTPLEKRKLLDPIEALKTIAVFRLMLPKADIIIAGGREAVLQEMQPFIFMAGANGMMVGEYLTTFGVEIDKDRQMLFRQGFYPRESK